MEKEKSQAKLKGYIQEAKAFNSLWTKYLFRAEQNHMRLTCNNTVHASLTFSKGVGFTEALEQLDRFMGKVASEVGVAQERLTYFGCVLSRPVPHCHLVVRTPKSRKTGFTVSRLPETQKQAILDHWKGMTGESVKLETVYNAKGLFQYWSGFHNVLHPGQIAYILK